MGLWGCWIARLAYFGVFRLVRDSASKMCMAPEEQHPTLFSGLYIHVNTHACATPHTDAPQQHTKGE